MESQINIEATKDSPLIVLDFGKRIFSISGPSFPENANKAYAPVLEWVEAFVPELKEGDVLECKFYYYYLNSSSKRIVYKVLKMLDDFFKQGKSVSVSWLHDEFDDDMLELGEEFFDLLSIPFSFVPQDH